MYLPIILRLPQPQPGSELYLLLQALKRVISCDSSSFKLPDIKLDRFNGNPKLGPIGSLSQSAIDDKQLNESEKVTFQTLVSGSAKEAINFYGCNPLFYKTAIEELRCRFGQPKHVVKSFISNCRNFSHRIYQVFRHS